MATPTISAPYRQASDEVQSLNQWILRTIGPYIKGRILEISGGTNSLCPLFIEYNRPIHLSTTNQLYLQTLRETYKSNRLIRAINDYDFMASNFKESHPDTLDVFDTVIALNVPMYDFAKIVDNIKYVLPQGGTLVMILPAYTYIYHGLDQNLDDWKRYNRKALSQILTYNFSILKVRYFNLVPDAAQALLANSGLSALAIFQKN